MVNLISKLKQWSTDFLEGSDEFLVDIENKPGSTKYRVLVDGLEGITIKRCAMISRYISKQIDEDLQKVIDISVKSDINIQNELRRNALHLLNLKTK